MRLVPAAELVERDAALERDLDRAGEGARGRVEPRERLARPAELREGGALEPRRLAAEGVVARLARELARAAGEREPALEVLAVAGVVREPVHEQVRGAEEHLAIVLPGRERGVVGLPRVVPAPEADERLGPGLERRDVPGGGRERLVGAREGLLRVAVLEREGGGLDEPRRVRAGVAVAHGREVTRPVAPRQRAA